MSRAISREGAGRYRGGAGLLRELEILGSYTRLTLSSDRKAVHPCGAFGGYDAAGSRCVVTHADGATTELASKVTTFLQQGDRLLTVTPGGGGWGAPRDRDPAYVRRDVQASLITRKRAREVYGVIVEDDQEDT